MHLEETIRRLVPIVLSVMLLLPLAVFDDVSAYSNTHKVSISTGPINLGPVDGEIDYSMNVEVSHSDSYEQGDTQNWNVKIIDGSIRVRVDQFSQPMPMMIGRNNGVSVPVTGVSGIASLNLDIFATASATVSLEGPATLSDTNLAWSGPESDSFTLRISQTADDGDKITVSIPVNVILNVGVSIDSFLGGGGVFSAPIGARTASPVIVEEITVGSPPLLLPGIEVMIGVGVAGGAAAIVVYRIKKRRPSTPRIDNANEQFGVRKSRVRPPPEPVHYHSVKAADLVKGVLVGGIIWFVISWIFGMFLFAVIPIIGLIVSWFIAPILAGYYAARVGGGYAAMILAVITPVLAFLLIASIVTAITPSLDSPLAGGIWDIFVAGAFIYEALSAIFNIIFVGVGGLMGRGAYARERSYRIREYAPTSPVFSEPPPPREQRGTGAVEVLKNTPEEKEIVVTVGAYRFVTIGVKMNVNTSVEGTAESEASEGFNFYIWNEKEYEKVSGIKDYPFVSTSQDPVPRWIDPEYSVLDVSVEKFIFSSTVAGTYFLVIENPSLTGLIKVNLKYRVSDLRSGSPI